MELARTDQRTTVIQWATKSQDKLARLEAGAQGLLNSRRLNETQLQLIRTELRAPALRTLSDDDLHDALVDVWSEVKLLTGAVLHEGRMLQLQMEVLRRFIATSPEFSALNAAEIRHAFYLNSQGELNKVYRHYNKELNAEFIGDVLLAYGAYKTDLYANAGAVLRGLLNPVTDRPPTTRYVLTPEDWKVLIQEDYEAYRGGKQDWIFGILPKYNFLRKAKLIPLRDRADWQRQYSKAMERRRYFSRRIGRSYTEQSEIREARRIYDRLDTEGWIPMEEHHRLVDDLRKTAYLRFFWYLSGCAVNDIFTEVVA